MVLWALADEVYDAEHVSDDKSQNAELNEPPPFPSLHIIEPAGVADELELSITVATSVTWAPAEMVFWLDVIVVDVLSSVVEDVPLPVELPVAIAWEKNNPFANVEVIIIVANKAIVRMFFILILPCDIEALKLSFMQSRMEDIIYAYN